MNNDAGLLVIATTNDDRDELDRIAKTLIERKLAACCQISGPLTSHYCWEGKLESSMEFTCTIKTTQAHLLVQAYRTASVPSVIAGVGLKKSWSGPSKPRPKFHGMQCERLPAAGCSGTAPMA